MANLLIARVGDRPSDSAADIALLLESAREPIRAAEYWNRAAQAAARLYAHEETARLALRGLALLEREPSSPHRAAAELDLQMTYGLAIKTSQGYAIPEVGKAYARARELCGQIEDPARVVPVLIGLAGHHVVSGEIRALHGVGLEMLDLFNRLGDPNLQMLGEWSVGAAFFHLGELETGHAHLFRGLDLYDPSFHRARVWETGVDPGIFCRCELARTFTLLGYPDQGLACAKEAVVQARSLSHPQALAFSLLFTALVHLTRRQPAEVCEVYAELSAHCRRHGIAQEMLWATPLCGRALVEIGDVTQGLEMMARGLDAHIATRSMLLRPFFFVLHAGALLRAGRLDAAEHALEESRVVAEATSQHAYDAEHRRLLAVVQTARGDVDLAMMHYEEALSIARAQNARWFELRAARGYAALLIEAQRPDEARQALHVCDWFTEGRETLDFVSADGLRKTL
jgi:predicted ATPase